MLCGFRWRIETFFPSKNPMRLKREKSACGHEADRSSLVFVHDAFLLAA